MPGRQRHEKYFVSTIDIRGHKSIKQHKERAREYFLKFVIVLKDSIHESVDLKMISRLNYNYYRYKKQNYFTFMIMWLFGFFYRPIRIILSSVAMIIAFGILFYILSHVDYEFVPVQCFLSAECSGKLLADLTNSIYFSGITFYTVGYSDLLKPPVSGHLGIVKNFLVLFEAALGMIFTSSIVIALLNKYHVRK